MLGRNQTIANFHDPGNCHGSLSLDGVSLGGILFTSTWYGSGGSPRFQTPARLPVVSNLNMGVCTLRQCVHTTCWGAKPARNTCAVVVAQKASGEPGLVCPQEVPVTQTASHPTPPPHTQTPFLLLPTPRHLPSHAHSLRTGLSRRLNSSTQSRAGRLPQTTHGAKGSGVRSPGPWACNRKLGSEGPQHTVG